MSNDNKNMTKKSKISAYAKIKPKLIEMKNKTKPLIKKTIDTSKEVLVKGKQKTKELHSKMKDKKTQNNNKDNKHSKERKLITPFKIVMFILILVFLFLFAKPLYYNTFYDDGEIKLLSPQEKDFTYPKPTQIECPSGRDCSVGFFESENTLRGGCPISCDDDNDLTNDYCSKDTGYVCINK